MASLPLKNWLPVFGIAFGVFGSNTSEFMPMGLLTIISDDMGISQAQVGVVISCYAWFVALASLPLMLAACKMEMRRLLLGVIAFFAVGQFLTAAATGFYSLLFARICVASCHALIWSIATPISSQIVPEEHRPRAVCIVITGASLASVVGQPLGRALALLMGWRATFFSIGIVFIAIFITLYFIMPQLRGKEAAFSYSDLPKLARNYRLLTIYPITVIFATGYFLTFSFIEPFMRDYAHISPNNITLVLTVYGIAALAASLVYPSLCKNGREKYLINSLFIITCIAMLLLKSFGTTLVASIIFVCICGVTVNCFNIVFQALTIKLAGPAASPIAMSLYSGIFNAGIASGAMFGGIFSRHNALPYIGYGSGALLAICALACIIAYPILLRPNHENMQ